MGDRLTSNLFAISTYGSRSPGLKMSFKMASRIFLMTIVAVFSTRAVPFMF
jgi:hypothetical protein